MHKLSVCIVTKNEEYNIEACLKSVSWADEIIVIDSFSTDRTVEICSKYTNNIIISEYKGDGPQKQQALSMTTNDWVLILDADEILTPTLQQEMQDTLKNPKYDGYKIPFQTFYCGKALHFGNAIKEKHLRLVRKSKNKIVPKVVHSYIEHNGKIGKLKNKILHYSLPDLEKVLQKIDAYSTAGAKIQLQKGEKSGLLKAIVHSLFTFVRGFILKLGFLDGKEGFMFAVSNAEGCYYRYLKLYHLLKST